MPEASSSHDATLALLRAAVDELKSLAHDPATVHMIADKLKHGIDALERALTENQQQEQKIEQKR